MELERAGDDARGGAGRRRRLHLELRELQAVYHLPLKSAAQRLGICEAALKRVCRRHRIPKWPYRQLSSVQRRIADLWASHHTWRAEDRLCHDRRVDQESAHLAAAPGILGDLALTAESEAVRLRALVSEHRRIVRSAHVRSTADASPRRPLSAVDDVVSPPPALLVLACACDLHADAGQAPQRWGRSRAYETAKLLGLVPPDAAALRVLAGVAANVAAIGHA